MTVQEIFVRTHTRSARSSSGSSARIVASIAMTIRAVLKSVMVSKCRGNPVSDQLLNSNSSHWGSSGSDSRLSIHLYSNPNTDLNRMPLTKAKG
ncbi:hypothetical protein Tco_0376630 [Tanacetum coccineum]